MLYCIWILKFPCLCSPLRYGISFISDDKEDATLPCSYDDAGSEQTGPSLPTTSPDSFYNGAPLSEGVMTDFMTNPHVIPMEEDGPLMKPDQALLMNYHENLGHYSFHQLKELPEKGIIQ